MEVEELKKEPDHSNKIAIMTQREDIEQKKMDKVLLKEINEMENLAGPGATNAKLVHDKILRTLNSLRKLTRENNRVKNDREKMENSIEESKKSIETSLKKK